MSSKHMSEIRLPYPLPRMQNPLWTVGFVGMFGSVILIAPYTVVSFHSWKDPFSVGSFLAIVLGTSLLYGLALRMRNLWTALGCLILPMPLVYTMLLTIKPVCIFHERAPILFQDVWVIFTSQLQTGLILGVNVSLALGFFVTISFMIRMKPAYDVTARLFLLAGIWLSAVSMIGVLFFGSNQEVLQLAVLQGSVSFLFNGLSYWQNTQRALWYKRVSLGAEPAWHLEGVQHSYGFLPPLFLLSSSIPADKVLVAHGQTPLVLVPTRYQDLQRALRGRNAIALLSMAAAILTSILAASRLATLLE